jgi:starch phosphorylase
METYTDVVCGMSVRQGTGLVETRNGRDYHFCSEYCRLAFLADPDRYTGGAGKSRQAEAGYGHRRIAYFSMEVAVDSRMATYSGGLGVLAGDTLRSFADLSMPVVAVSLLYRNGYFDQHLDAAGNQIESAVHWNPADFARALPVTVSVSIEGREVVLQTWRYDVEGIGGHKVPLFLLDSDVEPNTPADRELTGWLYGGDARYRLGQEIVLGIGGVRMLAALGFTQIERFHMNEGHSALLTLELLRAAGRVEGGNWDFEGVRQRCVFTTHTPVPAGHDQFDYELVRPLLGDLLPLEVIQMLGGRDRLNMTMLSLNASHFVNGVAKRHGEVTREMFAGYPIDSVTNGVHSRTWTCAAFQKLFDAHAPGWVNDPFALRHAVGIPKSEIWQAHGHAKWELVQELGRRGIILSTEAFTLGFARRATPYKRADLLLADPRQLVETAREVGPLQILYAGKAHPKDDGGKELIRRIVRTAATLDPLVRVVYLENYDLELAKLLTAGVDLWVNTPLRPLEASGTSGMKAAHNGVPSLSVLDGWWIEGHIEGVTGWSIGPQTLNTASSDEANRRDGEDLYRKLRAVVAPTFYQDRERWTEIMRQTITFNASFFNTHRMAQQYAAIAYV